MVRCKTKCADTSSSSYNILDMLERVASVQRSQ